MEGAEILVAIMIFLGVIALYLVIGTIIFRLACRFSGEAVPGFGRAMGIVVIAFLILFLLNIVLTVAFSGGSIEAMTDPEQQNPAAGLVSLLVGMFASAAIYSKMLPTTFGKGLVIWLIQIVMVIAVALVFGLLAAVLVAMLG